MTTIPARMTAIEIAGAGGPEVLRAVERPVPQPAAGEVLVQVEGAGVNRPDVMQRLGIYPPPPGASDIPGLEIAGTIVWVSSNAGRWQVSDRVCALVSGGGYAEYCSVPAVQCLPVPGGMDTVTAAAIPEAFFTVWTNLFQRGGLRAGERAPIHGGTGGNRPTPIPIPRAFAPGVFATAGPPGNGDARPPLGPLPAPKFRPT